MDPKKEGLAHALTEIDDRFLEEAQKKPIPFPAPALRLAAACLMLVLLCVPVYRHFLTDALKVNINGQNVLTASAQYTAPAAPAVAAFSARANTGFAVPLELAAGKRTLTLTAGSGSTLRSDDTGEQAATLSVTGESRVTWLLDISGSSRFQLTAQSGASAYLLTAEYDDAAGSVTITSVKK